MLTSSAKAKGRRLCQQIRDLLYLYAPDLKPGDIVVTPSGVNGPDLMLSPAARDKFPLKIECKNQEKVNIWAAYQQSLNHGGGEFPIVFICRNNESPLAVLDAEHFVKLIS